MLFLHSFSPICSQTFEDIVQRCSVEPTEGNVQQWVAEIAAVLNLKLRYSPLLHQRLADRYKHYARCLKMKKGEHGRAQYRSQRWTVPIEDADVDSVLLQQQVTELTNKVSTLTRELSDSVASLRRSRMESDQPSGVFRLVLMCVRMCVCVRVCVCACPNPNQHFTCMCLRIPVRLCSPAL